MVQAVQTVQKQKQQKTAQQTTTQFPLLLKRTLPVQTTTTKPVITFRARIVSWTRYFFYLAIFLFLLDEMISSLNHSKQGIIFIGCYAAVGFLILCGFMYRYLWIPSTEMMTKKCTEPKSILATNVQLDIRLFYYCGVFMILACIIKICKGFLKDTKNTKSKDSSRYGTIIHYSALGSMILFNILCILYIVKNNFKEGTQFWSKITFTMWIYIILFILVIIMEVVSISIRSVSYHNFFNKYIYPFTITMSLIFLFYIDFYDGKNIFKKIYDMIGHLSCQMEKSYI